MSNELTKQDVQQIQQAISRIEKKVDDGLLEMREDLRKIEMYLYNDSSTDTMGVIQQVRNHEKRIDGLEEESRFKKRVMAGIGILSGAITTLIYELIKSYYSK